jgi:3-oxosteroid 1-dehydrogenase
MSDWDHTTDAVIVGSGGGALCALLLAHERGLGAIAVEKTELVGGSTAMSGGGVWVPNNPLMQAEGIPDSVDDALNYFEGAVGDVGPASSTERRRSFLAHAPQMIRFLMDNGVRFSRMRGFPDYYDVSGSSAAGRGVEPLPFDANELGDWKPKLRPGFTRGMGGLAATTTQYIGMAYWNHNWPAFRTSARVVARTFFGKVRRKSLVCCGNALVGQMLKAALARDLKIWTESPVEELVVEDGRVVGVVVRRDGQRHRIRARHGVVLAAGGFAHNPEWRERYHGQRGMATWSKATPGDTGEVLGMAMELGAATDLLDEAVWNVAPRMSDGSPSPFTGLRGAGFSHARHRPGTIIVDGAGERYMNEAMSYMEAGQKMVAQNKKVPAIPSWLIFDDASRRRYPFGWWPGRLPEAWITSGFIKRADTLEALAGQCGIDAAGLQATVTRFNEHARSGQDPVFHRGESSFDRYHGDPSHGPNPAVGPLEKAPFYAAAVFPSDVGTFGGLLTDDRARVLQADGSPIPGLYATGTITASVMGRCYPGPGASIAATCTFGFVAMEEITQHAASATSDSGARGYVAADEVG